MRAPFLDELLACFGVCQNQNNDVVVSSYKELLRLVFGCYRKNSVVLILLGIISSLSSLLIPVISGYIFNRVSDVGHQGYGAIIVSLALFLMGFMIFSYICDMKVKVINEKIKFSVVPNAWGRVLSMPMQAVNKFISGDMVQRLSDYESAVSSALSTSMSILLSGIALIFLFIYMAYCNIILAGCYLGISVVFFIIKLCVLPKIMKCIASQFAEQGKLSSLLHEILLQINKIRSTSSEKSVFKKWLCGVINIKRYTEKAIKLELVIGSVEAIVPVLSLVSFYFVLYFNSADLSSYILLQFIVCAGQFSMLFDKISASIISLIHILPGFARVSPLFDYSAEPETNKIKLINFNGEISFSGVSLRNPETGCFILENISFDIAPGQFIAIIGPSGSGKTTLFKLLLGFESPSSGNILIHKENSVHLDMKNIRKNFGVVLQTTQLFAGTIFSNLSANTTVTFDEAWRLAKLVGLDDEINAMPMKMHTYLSDTSGESISGGQKQKILLGRALASQPRLLLLDEATSALDAKSQALIHENLKALNITRIVIAHRYNTIIGADKIYVMEKGKMIVYPQ